MPMWCCTSANKMPITLKGHRDATLAIVIKGGTFLIRRALQTYPQFLIVISRITKPLMVVIGSSPSSRPSTHTHLSTHESSVLSDPCKPSTEKPCNDQRDQQRWVAITSASIVLASSPDQISSNLPFAQTILWVITFALLTHSSVDDNVVTLNPILEVLSKERWCRANTMYGDLNTMVTPSNSKRHVLSHFFHNIVWRYT